MLNEMTSIKPAACVCYSAEGLMTASTVCSKIELTSVNVSVDRLTTPGRSQQVSSVAHVVLQMISKDSSPNCSTQRQRQDEETLFFHHRKIGLTQQGNSTDADPLLGPRVFTSLPRISKPLVGRLPSGRAGLSPTCWQSTDRDTLTWLTDRWT